MLETIYLMPGVNSAEYLRTLARFGRSTMGIRVMNAPQLAEFALMRAGVPINENIISSAEQVAVIAGLKNDIPYFSSSSYSDAGNIAASLGTLRSLIVSDEESTVTRILSDGEFPEKNRAVLELYNSYSAFCHEKELVDSVGLIRKAVENADKIRAVFNGVSVCCKESDLSPLELELVHCISEETGSVPDLTSAEKKAAACSEDNKKVFFSSAYGAVNEVEGILSQILENSIPLDECVVAVTDTAKYAQLFYDECSSLGVPVTFGCGVPVSNSKTAGFLKLLYRWDTSGFNGTDALRALVLSDVFNISRANEILGENRANWDDIISVAGNLRLCTDAAVNRQRIENYKKILEKSRDRHKAKTLAALESAEILFSEFEKGYSHILRTFTAINSSPSEPAGKIDRSALQVITDAIDSYLTFSGDGDPGEIIPGLLNRTVCSGLSREGAIHITDIAGAACVMRKNLFIAGLSATLFPGKPSENYLVLDSDYGMCRGSGFNPQYYELYPTSKNKIKFRTDSLFSLYETAVNVGADIRVSYPDFNFAELKPDEPSSALYKLYEMSSGISGERAIKECNSEITKNNAGFFSLHNGRNDYIGRARKNETEVLPSERTNEEYVMPDLPEPEAYIIPSAVQTFTECPLKYYFSSILGLETESADDPFVIANPTGTGNLLHSAMEFKGARDISKQEFLEYAGGLFDDYLASRPPLHESDAEPAKNEFLSLAENAYDTDKDKAVVLAEKKLEYRDTATGIKTGGYPDRIVYDNETGSYTVADFKSGKKIIQEDEKFAACVQALLYAYIFEKTTGKSVTGVEYRYPRYKKTVKHRFDASVAKDIEEYVFSALYKSLKTGEFRANHTPDEDWCQYCDFKELCTKEGEM